MAETLPDPTWSDHKLELGEQDEQDDVPKLIMDANLAEEMK